VRSIKSGMWSGTTPYFHRIAKEMQEHGVLGPGTSVVDLGCGCGTFLHHLTRRQQNLSVSGIDLSGRAIKIAQRHFPRGRFVVGSMRNLSFLESETVDLVVSAGSISYLPILEHLCDTLHEVVRVLKKPSGKGWLQRSGFNGCGPGVLRPPVDFVNQQCLGNTSWQLTKLDSKSDKCIYILEHA